MLPKDKDNIPLPMLAPDDPDSISEPQPFAHAQMVPCGECLRTNPPTRINCIYCGAILPLNESSIDLQKPTLRRLEKWEVGYNNILAPRSANEPGLTETNLEEAADIVKLTPTQLGGLLSSNTVLPVARAATFDEGALVQRRLRALRLETRVVSDVELGISEAGSLKVRALELLDEGLRAFQNPESTPIQVQWSDVFLIVTGRLISTRMELKEEKASRAENRILDSSQFFSDQVVFEIHIANQSSPFRIAANSFDFSCLAESKRLVSVENMTTLLEIFGQRAPQGHVDQSYHALRKLLDPVWPMEQQNESTGWRRERPGKYSVGSAAEKSNETQFMKYSLLSRYVYPKSESSV